MKAAAFVTALLLLTVFAALQQEPVDPVERGWRYLELHGSGAGLVEAAVATGHDPYDVNGRNPVAEIGVTWSQDPIAGLRSIYALAVAGAEGVPYGMGEMPISYAAMFKADAALNSSNDAAASWALMTLSVVGDQADMGGPVGQHLLDLQAPEGYWQCDRVPGPECTAFAILALDGYAFVPADSALRAESYLQSRRDGLDYLDLRLPANPVTTAWAAAAMERLGHDQSDVWAHVIAQQRSDGSWGNAWATADIVTLLSGGHPIKSGTR